ncbi:MAG: YciI family protein [Pseudomonadota bacterium]
MNYLFLLYSDENDWDQKPSSEKQTIINSYIAYSESLREAGAFVAGEPLDHSRNAKRVHADQVEDGPFADGKEQLGGFFMVDVKDLDQAIEWAARCPAASHGHVEIRPVWNISG